MIDAAFGDLETELVFGSQWLFATHVSEIAEREAAALFERIDSIVVQELMDYTHYDSADMLIDIMGFGHPPDADVPMSEG